MQHEIILEIEKLAGLGDGMGMWNGKKLFVPFTLPGDLVRAEAVRDTADAAYGRLVEVIKPGTDRIPPVCRHFGRCGGCTLQHIAAGAYREFKRQMAVHAVRKAGFDPARVRPVIAMPPDSRRRVEMKAEGGRLGYCALGSHRLIDVEECPVLEPALEALVLALKKQLAHRSDVTGIQINGVDNGYDVVVQSCGADLLPMERHPAMRRLSLCNAGGLHTLFSDHPVTVTLGGVAVEVPPQIFLQAARGAADFMTGWVSEATAGRGSILDLFAGIGTYCIPLAHRSDVTAMEGDEAMVAAMRKAIEAHRLKRMKAQARDLFQHPVSAQALSAFDAVIINPPRAGAKAQCEQLAVSAVSLVAMISCNPATFARDGRILKEGGYSLLHATPLDQFVYSPHLEMLAVFTKAER